MNTTRSSPVRHAVRIAGLILLINWAAPTHATSIYTDSFEGTSFDPYWTVIGPGSATITNTTAHTGSQSVQLTLGGGFPYHAMLSHDYGGEVQGSFSVYMQLGPCCGYGAAMELHSGNGDWVDLERVILGTTDARTSIGGVQTVYPVTFSPSTWQLLQVDLSSSGAVVHLNGDYVMTEPGLTSIRTVYLDVWAGPSGTAWFDDYSATASPEPATGFSLGGALACLISLAVRRKAIPSA